MSFYQLLNVNPDAGAGELRQAFRILSKRYHPDTTSLPADEASARFQQLQRAYTTLLDPERRQAYDAALRQMAQEGTIQRHVLSSSPTRRALSGGEWFALLLLAIALIFSLVIGIGLTWARGIQLVTTPSWGEARDQAPSEPLAAPALPDRPDPLLDAPALHD